MEEELLAMMPNLMMMTHAIFLGENSEFNKWYLQQEGKEFVYEFLREFLEVYKILNSYNILFWGVWEDEY